MVRQSFGARWDLDPARRDALEAVVAGVATTDRMIAELEAIKAGLLASAQGLAVEIMAEIGAPSAYQLPVRAIAADIAAATNVPDGTIRTRMNDATLLIEKFPATYAALCEGRVSRAHASVIAAEGLRLDDPETRSRYECVVLEHAAETTAGRLRPVAQAVAERIDPMTFAERHAAARDRRRTWVDDLGDGMSEFHAVMETVHAHGVQDRITQMAISVRDSARREAGAAFGAMLGIGDTPLPTDERTMPQIRADVFADLALTGHPTVLASNLDGDTAPAIRARVQITIPAHTLTGAGDEAAFLAGHGPIDPGTARRLAGGGPPGRACSSSPTPDACGRSTPTFGRPSRSASSRRGTSTAGSRAAAGRSTAATSTTRSRTARAAPPWCATSRHCAARTTCSSTTHPGTSSTDRAAR